MKISKVKVIVTAILVILSMLALAGCGSSTQQAASQKPKIDFPKKEITIVVPWNAGGGIDMMARKLQLIFKDEGINAVVKNVPGGNGILGISEVMNAKLDGYTVGLQTSTPLVVIAAGKSQLKADKFTNIAFTSEDPHVIAAKADAPWKDLKDLVEFAKKNPNTVTMATVGTNNVNHALVVLLSNITGAEFQHIPYDGASLVIPQIMGGHIAASVLKPSEAVSQVKEGKLKALAVNSDKRLETFPDTPTLKELGYDVWNKTGKLSQISYIVAPAGLEPALKERLIEIFTKAVQSESYQKFAKENGFIASPRSISDLDKDVNVLIDPEIYKSIFK